MQTNIKNQINIIFKNYIYSHYLKMGLNIGANAITAGGLYVGTILLVVMGILLVSATNKAREIREGSNQDGIDRLEKIDRDLRTAYILTFVAAAITFLIGAAYTGHETVWCPSEWWHGLFGVIALIVLIIAVVYAYIALNDLFHPDIPERNGADQFIWAALVVSVFAFLTMGAVGSGRVGYNAVGNDTTERLYMAEKKIHEAHSAITGQAMELKERPHFCDPCEDPCEEKEKKKEVKHTYVMPSAHLTAAAPVQRQVPVQRMPSQGFAQPAFQAEQPLGPPVTTRHSVVTTSQPLVSTPSMVNMMSPLSTQPGTEELI
jgi:NADH:ubiquinone oxidoreductase subunit 6 (subunit J)